MKIVTIHTEKIQSIFEQLDANFDGKVTSDIDEYKFDINDDFINGTISGSLFNDGIIYLQFAITSSVDLQLEVLNNISSTIYFMYCSDGNLSHSFGFNKEERRLKMFKTAIFTSGSEKENILSFEKGKKTKFSLIVFGNHLGSDDSLSLSDRVRKTFFVENVDNEFFYTSSYNLKIGEKIEQLNTIKQTGVVRNLLKEGILRIILAMEIQQYTDDLNIFVNDVHALTLREMEEIKELSASIKANPEESFTIKSLSKKSGLSPSKLQEGFKMIHNRTVNDYITHIRVLKAEILIRTSDLNISEIVYCIGFTSRSYFSKIFKQKFNCSPKDYKFNLGC